MANWFCSVFNVVRVVNVCPVHTVELIDTAWIVIAPEQKCINKKQNKKTRCDENGNNIV